MDSGLTEKTRLKMTILVMLLCAFPLDWRALSWDIQIKTSYNNKGTATLEHFWRSTGLCPSSRFDARTEFLLSEDEKINLDIIGALPNDAISMIRIHWLLDLVRVRHEDRFKKPVFDFESLDRLIARLHRNNLKPIFELMGNPSNYFHDFKMQFEEWASLIRDMISRYSGLYGTSYLKSWRFELTNEPDLKMYDRYNFTLENYIHYFRASESALKSLAGPAGLFRNNRKVHSLCWGLLDYCNLNPCNLDMITFHRKGDSVGSQVVDRSLELINSLVSNYPNLRGIPFGNDEADVQKGWIQPLEWRGDVRYAALVGQIIIGHLKKLILDRNLPFKLLSNDNAFLSYSPNYFTQRTLLARFQMNNISPPHTQFIKKPVYSVMALLSLLGNEIRNIKYSPGDKGFSYIVTSQENQDVFFGVLTHDKARNNISLDNSSYITFRLKLELRNSTRSGLCVAYNMDNLRSNPYKVWMDGGSPDFPDADLRRNMRLSEGFRRLFVRDFKAHQTHITLKLKNVLVPSVFLVSVCFEGTQKPGPVSDLRYEKIFNKEVLLLWKDIKVRSRCLLTYIVEYRKSNDDTFVRINDQDSIFLSYHFDGRMLQDSLIRVNGEYRVAAVDYWNRTGPFSETVTVL